MLNRLVDYLANKLSDFGVHLLDRHVYTTVCKLEIQVRLIYAAYLYARVKRNQQTLFRFRISDLLKEQFVESVRRIPINKIKLNINKFRTRIEIFNAITELEEHLAIWRFSEEAITIREERLYNDLVRLTEVGQRYIPTSLFSKEEAYKLLAEIAEFMNITPTGLPIMEHLDVLSITVLSPTKQQVIEAYRRAVKQNHPDLVSTYEAKVIANQEMCRINQSKAALFAYFNYD